MKRRLGRFARTLRSRFWAPPIEEEVDREVTFHLDMRIREYVAQGYSLEGARAEALKRFGDIAAITREARAEGTARDQTMHRTLWRSELGQDLRFAVRQLIASPLLAVAAIGTLALGIGSSATIFSIANTVLLRPFPFQEPDRLVRVWETNPRSPRFASSAPNLLDWRVMSRGFDGLAGFQGRAPSLVGEGEPERLRALAVTEDFFTVLGVPPIQGRGFTAEETRTGAGARVALISERLWQRRFASDPAILTRTMNLDGTSIQIVGIMTTELDVLSQFDVWLPLELNASSSRADHRLSVIGRLKAGTTFDAAVANLRDVAARLATQYPASNKDWGVNVASLQTWIVGDELRSRVIVLMAGVGLLLLMACVNVANLLLARAGSRHREMSVRTALGAGRWRIVRQLMTESLVVAGLGALLGVAFTLAAVPLLRGIGEDAVARFGGLRVDGAVLAFGVAAGLGTGLLFGVAPALHLARTDLHGVLRSGTRMVETGRLRGALIVSSVALATLLLAGAGLIGGSFQRLMRVDTGLNPRGVLAAQLALPESRYPDDSSRVRFVEGLLGRVSSLPGVSTTGAINIAPFAGGSTATSYVPSGQTASSEAEYRQASWRAVTPGYFAAAGLTLKAGRLYDGTESQETPAVIVVSEALANEAWPGQDAVGKELRPGGRGNVWTVIGVVNDTRDIALETEPAGRIYLSYRQVAVNSVWLVLRGSGAPMDLLPQLRREVWALDNQMPVTSAQSMNDMLSTSAAEPRLTAMIFGLFAASALALAVLGIYGLIAYGVTQRTREIGVRLALGARPGQILSSVLGRGVLLALVGTTLGVGSALLLGRYVRSILFGIKPNDPLTYILVAGVLLASAALASLLPARRAAGLDPMKALADGQ